MLLTAKLELKHLRIGLSLELQVLVGDLLTLHLGLNVDDWFAESRSRGVPHHVFELCLAFVVNMRTLSLDSQTEIGIFPLKDRFGMAVQVPNLETLQDLILQRLDLLNPRTSMHLPDHGIPQL